MTSNATLNTLITTMIIVAIVGIVFAAMKCHSFGFFTVCT